ncbi:hypothetical protein Tsubulata_003208 [Turnera subulata]|uniref:CCHC-type domain-containing protein n=1 Tax=Turnera subulata TaxID=218843 RepID=A0A9Q0JS61_9ROSI|nr:hypothetical protein Tsubulata_003208 [Turnera subulata]
MGRQDLELSLKSNFSEENRPSDGSFGAAVASLVSRTVLIIRVVSNRIFKSDQIQNALKKCWGCKGDVFFTEKGFNNFLVCFELEVDQQMVFLGAPWSIFNYHIIVRKWLPHLTWEQIDLSKTTFWIQVFGLPVDFLSEENAIAIGKSFAGLVEIDSCLDNIVGKESFIRLKVCVDVNLPLATGFFFKDERNICHWVRFKYEGLEEFCYLCGVMGHIATRCVERDTISEPKSFMELGKSYGPHLWASGERLLLSVS